jgi:hypothetical protein
MPKTNINDGVTVGHSTKAMVNPMNTCPVDDCVEWIKGYVAAMADYDLDKYHEHPSIMAALLYHGIDGDLLEACLLAAEIVRTSGEWYRWPSVPVRGFESPVPRGWSIIEAMNDEVG